ncbi:phytoene/squalene synthase family protein [Halobacterium salinarum]|uniref:phytoene/squalene synthase family protein n=1 Tax=Halobacterium salinarum TaxID=2242 RepID=UPI00255390B2|nr:phytoene/squalene synthase family protein [Halobacterium salinarum]MDL0118485.1 phytoene/squalene synthase family protein [Halobacterium salinarum]MDL0120297.1 phytoene/squalene synthase family protein [Halobacterium salinarum]
MIRHHTGSSESPLTYCHDTVQDVSRTFALTIDALDPPLADQICVGYLLCRIPDTIEDAAHIPAKAQQVLLKTYQEILKPEPSTSTEAFTRHAKQWIPTQASSPDWDLVKNTSTVIAAFERFSQRTQEAMRPPIREMIRGMLRFIQRYASEPGIRIQTTTELRSYCHYVAGTVGTLITNLLVKQPLDYSRETTLRKNAEHFGRLLQLVNIAKDVRDDYVTESNVYLPNEWLATEGVPQDEVIHTDYRSDAISALFRTLNQAQQHLDPAQSYIEKMPLGDGNTVAAWAVPYLLAVGTLRELRADPGAAFSTTESLS